MNDLYIKNPIIAPKVFIIRSSISVRRLFNNWLISISMEKENPARAVRCSDLIFFQIKWDQKPKRNEQDDIQNISDHIDSRRKGDRINVGNFCLEAIPKMHPHKVPVPVT